MAEPVGFESPALDRRKVLLGLLFAGSAGIAFARQPRQPIDYLGKTKLDKLIPNRIGEWEFASTSGLVVPPEDALSAALYSQMLTRTYTHADEPPIMLLIAQSAGQTGVLQIHRPEFCYPANGFQLTPITPRPIAVNGSTFAANQLTATQPGRTEQILYWTRVGEVMPPTWAAQKMAVAVANLKGEIPDAVLVRISTIDPDQEAAFNRLQRFVAAMVGSLPADRRKVLVADA
ncbi:MULTISPECIES: exosortase-associated protein EpsI, V-type [Sphingomonas]|uniref:exosortase-associated protein EpsI, V-type n=1 Tax=Sphingomonas TaxID=13687 RepID=UPI000DEFB820|nr:MULTISPECIES: exosortase-associated protein EpsI, V-type [Sphingomonas]